MELKKKYFDILEYGDFIFTFCHFRTINYKLPVEYGGWNNVQMESRVPNLSKSQDLRDEFHYLLKCSFMLDIKKNCINNIFFSEMLIIRIKYPKLYHIINIH